MSEVERPAEPARTARQCPKCGETVTELPHQGCIGLFKEVMQQPPSTKSSIDDMPKEVEEVAEDPTRKLNQYILVSQIGRGGMGIVWKAWDTKLTRWAAIKFLSAQEPSDVLRFEREAKLAARLRHPNIAAIFEVGETVAPVPGNPIQRYLAMEFIDGLPLSQIEDLDVRDWLQVFVQVGRAVDTAHKAGVVHRDLKPHNIMLTKERYSYVMDFGLAKSLRTDTSLSASGAVMGTPSFMPPEQAQAHHEEVDERSDTYSLGATLYSVLCKAFPFDGHSAIEVLGKVCKEEPRRPRELNPDIPEEIEAVLLKAMAKEKADRYQTAGELADDLQLFLSAGEVAAQPPSPLKRAFRKVRRSPVTYLLAMGAAAAVAAAVYLPRGNPDPKPGPSGPSRDQLRTDAEVEWTRLNNSQKEFKRARNHLLSKKHLFDEKRLNELLNQTETDCRTFLNEELESLRGFLKDIASAAELRRKSLRDFDQAFSLPSREELIVDDPVYDWVQKHLPVIRDLRKGPTRRTDLFAMAEKAAGLVKDGENSWFLAIERIAFEDLHSDLNRHLADVQREREPQRLVREKDRDALKSVWDGFLDRLGDEFLERHTPLQEDDRTVQALLADWPAPIPSSEISGKALDALRLATPGALEDARKRLEEMDKPKGLAVESRQELYTWIVIVEANRQLIENENADDAVALSGILQIYGGKLHKELGGPTPHYRPYGPKIDRVFKELEARSKR